MKQLLEGKPVNKEILFNIWDETVEIIMQQFGESQEDADYWKQTAPEEKRKEFEFAFEFFVAETYKLVEKLGALSGKEDGVERQQDTRKSDICTERIAKEIISAAFNEASGGKLEKIINEPPQKTMNSETANELGFTKDDILLALEKDPRVETATWSNGQFRVSTVHGMIYFNLKYEDEERLSS